VYKITFSDGTVWALKIPRRGHREEWSEIAARALLSEAHTMRFLKEQTKIPLPEVYDFNATLDNELKCPYIMMEWLSGEALMPHWDRYAKKHELFQDDRTRTQLLIDIASAVVQLDRFQFNTCGAPSFDAAGRFSGIGPVITRDLGPETIHAMPDLIDVVPFSKGSQYFSWKIDVWGKEDDSIYKNAHQDLFKAMLSWMDEEAGQDAKFVFSHIDLGPQNVLVDSVGRFCGLIDFDGVTAVPRCLGNGIGGSYPHWLTRDQDLWAGEEDSNTSQHEANDPLSDPEYSIVPEEADYWRAVWRACIQDASRAQIEGEHFEPRSVDGILDSTPRTYAAGLTPGHSLDGRILWLAHNAPDTKLVPIVTSIVDRISHLQGCWPSVLHGTDQLRGQSTLTLAAVEAWTTESDAININSTTGHISHPFDSTYSSSRPSVSTEMTDLTSTLTNSTAPTVYSDNNSIAQSTVPSTPRKAYDSAMEWEVSSGGGTAGLGDGRGQQSAAGGPSGFRSWNILADIGSGTLCEEDWSLLKNWFLFLYAGKTR